MQSQIECCWIDRSRSCTPEIYLYFNPEIYKFIIYIFDIIYNYIYIYFRGYWGNSNVCESTRWTCGWSIAPVKLKKKYRRCCQMLFRIYIGLLNCKIFASVCECHNPSISPSTFIFAGLEVIKLIGVVAAHLKMRSTMPRPLALSACAAMVLLRLGVPQVMPGTH